MIRSIHTAGSEPVHTGRPTSDWWTVTTDDDVAMGHPALVVEVPMDSTAEAIAAAYAGGLRADAYACDREAAAELRGTATTIYLTAPDGAETEHEGCYHLG